MDVAKLKAFAGMGAGQSGSLKGGMVAGAAPKVAAAKKPEDLAKKAKEMLAKAIELAGTDEVHAHLMGFDADEDEAPEGVLDVPLWKRSVSIAEGIKHDEPMAVAMALYGLMGGKVEEIVSDEAELELEAGDDEDLEVESEEEEEDED